MQRFRLAILVLAIVLAGGVTGYVLIEGWPIFDALYMTVITVATVGFSEVRPLSPSGRTFTMALIVVGRAVEVYAIVVFTQVLVVEQLRDVIGRRRMEKTLSQLDRHYIICGWGRMGQEIVDQFRLKRVPFVVIEINPEKCRRLQERGMPVVQGDAADDQTLRAAGVERARGLIAVAPKDADNVFITLSARALKRDLFIVARCAYEQDVQKIRTAGADRVISPYIIGARRIAAAAFHPTVVDFLDQEVHRENAEWELEEIIVSARAAFAGKSLRDCGIRQQTGCTVLAIKEAATNNFNSNPPPDAVLQIGDTLIALGTPQQLERLEVISAIPPAERAQRRTLR
jgi:voltage-gated potassium channel